MPTKSKNSPLEKPDLEKELKEEIGKLLELKVEVPDIEETLKGAEQALQQAKAIKRKKLTNHYCTECNGTGIQLYLQPEVSGHFPCFIDEDGQYVDEHGEPFTDPAKLKTFRIAREKGKL